MIQFALADENRLNRGNISRTASSPKPFIKPITLKNFIDAEQNVFSFFRMKRKSERERECVKERESV